VSLYGQEPEATLLSSYLSLLDHRSVIDVGAERGAFVEQMLSAESDVVHIIEPDPTNVAFLRERFANEARVTIHPYAASDADRQLELHTSVSPDGSPVTFGHTVLSRPDTDQIAWKGTVEVTARSLESLLSAGEIPARVGVLKIDTEGHDLAVVAGMGDLDSDVVMVEHWSNLPHALGTCPWSAEEMLAELRPRGFSDFAFIVHRGAFVTLQWNDFSVMEGDMGNLVFLHARVGERLLPATLDFAASLTTSAAEVGELYVAAANERLAVIKDLESRSLMRRVLGDRVRGPRG